MLQARESPSGAAGGPVLAMRPMDSGRPRRSVAGAFARWSLGSTPCRLSADAGQRLVRRSLVSRGIAL